MRPYEGSLIGDGQLEAAGRLDALESVHCSYSVDVGVLVAVGGGELQAIDPS